MTNKVVRQPTVLEHEPLINVLFEVRFEEPSTLVDLLPGLLVRQEGPQSSFSRLPATDIPRQLREVDPGLMYAPVVQIEMEKCIVAAGDRAIIIRCKLPYPKWLVFKSVLLDCLTTISRSGIDTRVSRYSLKYVNLISAPTLTDQLKKINMSLMVGGLDVNDNHINVRVQHIEDSIAHIITIITGANGCLPNGVFTDGVVVDVDSVCNIPPLNLSEFNSSIEPAIEFLRQANKSWFFKCLNDDAVELMGPRYE